MKLIIEVEEGYIPEDGDIIDAITKALSDALIPAYVYTEDN